MGLLWKGNNTDTSQNEYIYEAHRESAKGLSV